MKKLHAALAAIMLLVPISARADDQREPLVSATIGFARYWLDRQCEPTDDPCLRGRLQLLEEAAGQAKVFLATPEGRLYPARQLPEALVNLNEKEKSNYAIRSSGGSPDSLEIKLLGWATSDFIKALRDDPDARLRALGESFPK